MGRVLGPRSGNNSVALGHVLGTRSGNGSVAMGCVLRTRSGNGSFALGTRSCHGTATGRTGANDGLMVV